MPMSFQEEIASYGEWYHRIEVESGVFTPGDRNQALTFALYRDLLPDDLSDLKVLDLGANACGLSVEFAKRGAKVTAVEPVEAYVRQAQFVIKKLELEKSISLKKSGLFDALDLGEFDIVCYVGLSYHMRYPQLALDMLSWCCKGQLLVSSQTIDGDQLIMRNRAWNIRDREFGKLHGYEPTEDLFLEMITFAGFQDATLVSTAPHVGETGGSILGNRSYFHAFAGDRHALPFSSGKATATIKGRQLNPRMANTAGQLGKSWSGINSAERSEKAPVQTERKKQLRSTAKSEGSIESLRQSTKTRDSDLRKLRERVGQSNKRAIKLENERNVLRERNAYLKTKIREIETSRSWKLTRPLRFISSGWKSH